MCEIEDKSLSGLQRIFFSNTNQENHCSDAIRDNHSVSPGSEQAWRLGIIVETMEY